MIEPMIYEKKYSMIVCQWYIQLIHNSRKNSVKIDKMLSLFDITIPLKML